MKLAVDVFYNNDIATIVGALFSDWQDEKPNRLIKKYRTGIDSNYVPGEFYKRELPCIMAILQEVDVLTLAYIIIDGYVYLDNENRKGLGAILYDTLEQKIPVIGVAKNRFHPNTVNVFELLRGESKKPLYITAAGVLLSQASSFINQMAGKNRMPSLLQLVDTETKKV